MRHLESLIAEYLESQGFLIRRNTKRRPPRERPLGNAIRCRRFSYSSLITHHSSLIEGRRPAGGNTDPKNPQNVDQYKVVKGIVLGPTPQLLKLDTASSMLKKQMAMVWTFQKPTQSNR